MSTSQAPARGGGGYQRSANGLLGAMVATVLVVVAFVAFRGLTRDNEATEVPSVDWAISLKAARADGRLQVLAPATLPSGWRATSASYLPGAEPAWHLGLLTAENKYVGIEESRGDLADLVRDKVNGQASRGDDVSIDGSTWRVYRGSGGDYALGRTVQHAGEVESQLVVGTAPPSSVRDFAGTLAGG